MNTYTLIKGIQYHVRFVARLDVDGEVDPPEDLDPEMRLRADLSDEELMETLLHETIHVHCWCLSEDCVNDLAADQAKILMQFGYARRRHA